MEEPPTPGKAESEEAHAPQPQRPPPGHLPTHLPGGTLRELMGALRGRGSASPRVPASPTASSTSTSTSTSASTPTGTGATSASGYFDFLIGDPAWRAAKAQLGRYRASLAAEAARAEAGAQRGVRALRAFEAGAQRDAEQLRRTGGRHLPLFDYMAGLRAALLRLELAQWQRAGRALRAREAEAARAMERLSEVLAASKGGRLEEGSRHLQPSPQALLAADAELAGLRRRAGLLARVCDGVGAEASLLISWSNGGNSSDGKRAAAGGEASGGANGCEGCGAGLEGPVESVEERRRKLLHLAEEAAVLYFGGPDRDEGVGQEDEGSESPESARAAAAAAVAVTVEEGGGESLQQRQREVVQLRLKCEREFACLVADERHREGRLLARWLELVREVAGDEESADGGGDGGGGEQGEGAGRRRQQQGRDRDLERSLGSASHSSAVSAASASSSTASTSARLFPACDAPIHAPRCIAAFIHYFVRRLKELYQLDEGVKPALVGLTQALVFRRARRVCFGYVKGSAMRRLNGLWRDKMLLVRRLSPQALGVPDAYAPQGQRRPYQATSRALTEMALCLTPQEMSDCLLTAVRALHVEARLANRGGPARFVDADTMFPVLLFALAQADVPDMYACLYLLRNFAAADYVGEKAYFITTLGAAVSHLQQLELEEMAADDDSDGEDGLRVRPPPPRKDSGLGPLEAEAEEADLLEKWGPCFSGEETRRALEYLDGFLAMELNMEQTIELLEKDGWW